jgi:molecular chaperone HtpG
MHRVQLPAFFEQRLNGTQLSGPVNVAIDRCSSFFGDPTRGLTFFPEFTDHGVTHVQDVLRATEFLITEEAREVLTVEDVAVLVLAILLHDSAMHLTVDGFLSLIDRSIERRRVSDMDQLSWPDAWDDFLGDASRWDGRRLHAILGDVRNSPGDEAGDLAGFVRSPSEMG